MADNKGPNYLDWGTYLFVVLLWLIGVATLYQLNYIIAILEKLSK